MEILNLIGNTPIVRLKKLTPPNVNLLLKLEYLNPSGSHKDRIALYMIRDAEERGLLKPRGLVVEESSGNTGMAVALIARLKGYEAVIVVSREVVTREIKRSIELLGARVVEGSSDPTSPDYAERLAEEIASREGGVFLNQSSNIANIKAHYETTGPEIWVQTRGRIDAFVMGVGTGGTITGVGRYLKQMNPEIRIVAVTPKGSSLSRNPLEKPEAIPGLASKRTPQNYDPEVVDEVVEVGYEEALGMARMLVREEGVMAGISTGANIVAARKIAEKLGPGKTVVTIAADSILKYASII